MLCRRSGIVSSILVLIVIVFGGQSRAAPPNLLTPPTESAAVSKGLQASGFGLKTASDAQANATVMAKESVGINLDLLAKPSNLTAAELDGAALTNANVIRIFSAYHGVDFDVVLNRFVALGDGVGVAWYGHVQGMAESEVHIVARGGTASGNIRLDDGSFYQLRYTGNGNHAFLSIDPAQFPRETELDFAESGLNADAIAKFDSSQTNGTVAGEGAAADGLTTIDVMVVYNPATRDAAGGTTAIQTLIDLAVAETNTGFENSGINQRIRLVHTEEVAYTETSDFGAALTALTDPSDGLMDNVHALRDTHKADMVSLFVAGGNYCGIAWLMTNPSAAFESRAFSVVKYNCATGNYSFAHELGHNLAANHDRSATSNAGAYPSCFGYQDPEQNFRTVMAYPCTSAFCPRINYWSNPDVSFNGLPTGIVHTASDAADNRMCLNNTAAIASNWRQGDSSSPAVISSPLSGATLSSSEVTFQWTAGTEVSQYSLDVGTAPGGSDIYSQSWETALEASVGGLPTDGSTVYVRLGSLVAGAWQFNDYSYTACSTCGGGTPAAMTSPAPGATLTSSEVTFQWTAGTGASQYVLYVGTTPGGTDIRNLSSLGSSLKATVAGLPSDGSTFYVRLGSLIAGAWQYNDYTYVACGTCGGGMPAAMSSPAPGATLSSSEVTFQWTAGNEVSQYSLHVGTTPGGTDIKILTLLGSSLKATVAGLPSDGGTVYVRLGSLIAGAWQYNDYKYVACGTCGGTPAAMSSPAPGTTLTASEVTFQWTAGKGVSQYSLDVGTTPGGADIHDVASGTSLNATIGGLPTDGSTVYVSLGSLIAGAWQYNEYKYVACSACGDDTPAEMSSPAPGTTLTASEVTFQWTAGKGISQYWLYAGTTPGGRDIYNQSQGSGLQATVGGLPTDGSSVYVRLWSKVSGTWRYTDYTYTGDCATCAGNGSDATARMASPTLGSTLSSSTVTYKWKVGTDASQYWLYVGTTPGGRDIYNKSQGTSLAATVANQPTNGGAVYVRLWSRVQGSWQYVDYKYNACNACGSGASS